MQSPLEAGKKVRYNLRHIGLQIEAFLLETRECGCPSGTEQLANKEILLQMSAAPVLTSK